MDVATRSSARSHLLHPSSCHELLQNKLSVALFHFKLGLVHFFSFWFPCSAQIQRRRGRLGQVPPETNKPQIQRCRGRLGQAALRTP